MNMIFASAMLALGLAPMAAAQDAGGARGACKADFEKYCSDVAAGGGARVKCLDDNKDKLSDGCKSALASMTGARADIRKACAPDAMKYCADSQPGGERLKCMMANKDKLSDVCKTALAELSAGGQ